MSRLTHMLAAALLCAALTTTLAAQGQTKPIDPANIDSTCAPCQDFFQYANGGWIERNTIPGDQPRWGSFNELQEANYAALKDVLTEAAEKASSTRDPNIRKLGTFYGTCMDSTAVEAAGIRPLRRELDGIDAIRDRNGVEAAIARLHGMGIPAAFAFRSTPDAKKSSRTIAEVYQGGLGLPDRDYYLKGDSASEKIRAQYVEHVGNMLRLSGADPAAASRAAAAIMRLETELATASMTREAQRDPEAVYHLTRTGDLRKMSPRFGWGSYLSSRGLKGVREVNVGQPQFVAAVDSLLSAAPVADWKDYLRWTLIANTAPALSSPFVEESFRFNSTVLRGVKEMRPRWKRCLTLTDQAVGEILGQAYVRKNFTPEAKARALEMVQNIRAELKDRLEALTWMSQETKVKAYAKLDSITNKVGYPDKWRDYAKLEARPGPFVANLLLGNRFEAQRGLSKIGKPTDRTDWGMTAPTVNAYYNAPTNEITFPAGIMQPPFFNPKADDAVNYGGMGGAIGHEITHGFDDEGRKFDAQGNLSGWWTDSDSEEFNRRAEVVRKQFDGYVAIDSLRVNGKLTLGENIADLGGLLIAHGGYRRSLKGKPEPTPIDGFIGDQRFFLAWAQIWRAKQRPEFTRLLVTTDPHAPPKFRTNGPLSNIPAFAKAFGCKPGDPMVRPEGERAQIW
ncbi:MAG TPA: M13 family metallopeptidase [Gemmatimonadales bacterium]|nr:M13 family metallopeptidase [Gemmatimonadales bacterium]